MKESLAKNTPIRSVVINHDSIPPSVFVMNACFGISPAYWYLDSVLFMKYKDEIIERFRKRKETSFDFIVTPSPFRELKTQVLDHIESCCRFPLGIVHIIGSLIGLATFRGDGDDEGPRRDSLIV